MPITYTPTTWQDHLATNLNRRTLTPVDGELNVYDVEKTQGEILQQGTPINATNLNKIEQGIVAVTASANASETAIVDLQAMDNTLNGYINQNTIDITAHGGRISTLETSADPFVTFTEPATLTDLVTGSKLSVNTGRTSKAIKDYGAHKANTTNPHGVTKAQVGLGNVLNVAQIPETDRATFATAAQGTKADAALPATSTAVDSAKLNGQAASYYAIASDLTTHTGNTSNPHAVTTSQVGLGNVLNVAQIPETDRATFATAAQGTKADAALPATSTAVDSAKLNGQAASYYAIASDLTTHTGNTSNPHAVTKSQVGLGSVENTAAATAATVSTIAKRDESGHLTAVGFKTSIADTTTAATHYYVETATDGFIRPKTLANVRAEIVTAADIKTKLLSVDGSGSSIDADLLDGQHASDFMPISNGVLENYREKLVTLSGTSTTINLSLGNVFTHSLTGNTTYTITNAVSEQAHSFTLIINQTATVRTVTFPASVKWQGGEIPDLTTASKTYVLTFMTVNGGTNWLGMFGGEF